MNFDTLKSKLDAERANDNLTGLDEEFFEQAHEHLAELKEEAEEADDAAEQSRLTDEYDQTKTKLLGLIDRRQGKLIRQASLASTGYTVERDAMTEREEAQFEELVETLQNGREAVLPDE